MRLHIFILLGVLAAVASAGYGVNIKKLLATKGGGTIDSDDLKSIISSTYNQYAVVTFFFSVGNPAGVGKLNQLQFAKAYSAFIYFLLGKKIDPALLATRWSIATWEQDQSDYVDLAGFTFLITLDLRFVYDNYCLFDGNLHKLPQTIKTLQSALKGISTNDIIAACFFGADFNKDSKLTPAEFRSGLRILGYILGVNISYTTGLLNDLFAAADANGDMKLSSGEVLTYINEHLGTIEGLITMVANA